MIYLLKFGASFVLPPGIFFLLAWALSVYIYKKGLKYASLFLTGITFVFYFLSTGLVAGWLMSNLESIHDQPSDPRGDVIVMLGGGATSDTPN